MNYFDTIFSPGHLTLITGRPKMGSTCLVLSLLEINNKKPLFLNLNTIDLIDDSSGREQHQKQANTHFLKERCIDNIIEFILNRSEHEHFDIIVIDNINSIANKNIRLLTPKSRYLEKKIRRLKQLALAMRVPIFVIGIGSRKLDQMCYTGFSELALFENRYDTIIIPYRWEYYGEHNLYQSFPQELKEGEVILTIVESTNTAYRHSVFFDSEKYKFRFSME